jgi:UDP-3-O-[3-hydroxymyristoyl] glucosamine N-acyltransferase
MRFTLKEIAIFLGAQLEGDPMVEIHTIAKIEEGHAGAITFLANPKYTEFIYSTQASAVIVQTDFLLKQPIDAAILRVADPYLAFTALLEKAQSNGAAKTGIDAMSSISASATIGKEVFIGAFVSVGANAVIGDGVRIYPNTTIGDGAQVGAGSLIHSNVAVYHGCLIGKQCVIHSNSSIGSDGFGFAPQADGTLKKIPQTGIVRLEDHVEIGAGCTIDRATMGETVIRKGVKIDNLVQVAHNVEIGESTVIAAQAGISGSTKIGKYCMIGGQVGIVGHLKLADFTKIGAQSGISKSVEKAHSNLRGSPAQEYRAQLKSEVLFRQLVEMAERLHALEKKMNSITKDKNDV